MTLAGITISHVLADCLDALDAGQSLEECLDRYPRHRQQLRPLLETALALEEAPVTAEPGPQFVSQLRDQLMAWGHEGRR